MRKLRASMILGKKGKNYLKNTNCGGEKDDRHIAEIQRVCGDVGVL